MVIKAKTFIPRRELGKQSSAREGPLDSLSILICDWEAKIRFSKLHLYIPLFESREAKIFTVRMGGWEVIKGYYDFLFILLY